MRRPQELSAATLWGEKNQTRDSGRGAQVRPDITFSTEYYVTCIQDVHDSNPGQSTSHARIYPFSFWGRHISRIEFVPRLFQCTQHKLCMLSPYSTLNDVAIDTV
jgi:hypothetical protein